MSKKSSYISCIKIAGKPILPPIITPKVSDECRDYRHKALELQRKLERNRLFKQCMQDLLELQQHTQDLVTQPTTTLENQLTILEEPTIDENDDLATKPDLSHLRSETIDVIQYSDAGICVISETTPRPKLIRSNSYTLDSPSPILLAHLEREALRSDDSQTISLSPVTVVGSEPKETEELLETDVTIEQLSISTPLFTPTRNLDQFDGLEPQLFDLLSKLPGNCANSILEIIESQRLRQKAAIDQFSETIRCEKIVQSGEKPMGVSISSNQSVYYSVPEEGLNFSRSFVDLNNFRNGGRGMSLASKREWAASKIGAAVRGYLIRRLIKTEKVQSLIETIKDALLCALQLHSAEVIDDSDIELHRRLIQQVSAACCAFHDVFFTLSTKEQMGMISLDRQRRIEKAKRPSSTRLSTPRSGRNSAKVKLLASK